MARRRRGRGAGDPEHADLDAPEHAWWAAGSTDPFERPPEPGTAPAPEPEPEPATEPEARDPYDVLRVAPSASWDDIVASHRRLVRRWHPDGLGEGSSDEERELCADRMREVNEAYQALLVKRDR
jgi:DnaJ-domain-containing protein 1